MKKRIEKPWSDIVFLIGITIAVYLGIRYLLPLVFPFLLALLFAAILNPLVKKLENKIKLPRGLLSFLVVILALIVIGVPVIWLVYKLIREFCSLIGGYKSWKGEAEQIWCMCCERIEQISGIKAATVISWGNGRANSIMTNMEEKVVPFLMDCSINGLKGIAGFFWKFLVTMVATVLTLTDFPKFRERFLRTKPGKIIGRLGKNTMHAGGAYLKAQFIIFGIVSAICVVGLFLTGNRYALLAGVGIGFCDALPFVGTGIIFVPWLILKLFQGEYLFAVVYGVLYIVCNITREFLEPKLVGKGLGIHPLSVIISLYVGMCVFGGLGILLGPLSALLIWECYQMRQEYERQYGEETEE
jgi:sporulation integral membrane protein YtvI